MPQRCGIAIRDLQCRSGTPPESALRSNSIRSVRPMACRESARMRILAGPVQFKAFGQGKMSTRLRDSIVLATLCLELICMRVLAVPEDGSAKISSRRYCLGSQLVSVGIHYGSPAGVLLRGACPWKERAEHHAPVFHPTRHRGAALGPVGIQPGFRPRHRRIYREPTRVNGGGKVGHWGGDRLANAALYRVVLVRLSHDLRTREYMHCRTREGMSKPRSYVVSNATWFVKSTRP